MLALDPVVVDAVWASFAAYLPEHRETGHPLGCHRPRISDRDCFEAILFRLVTGCSWDVAGRLGKGSETTLRRRRDEWVAARAFEHLVEEAIAGFDKVIGLDFSDACQSTGRCTRRRVAEKEPDPTRPIEARRDGSGHWPPIPTGCRSAG
jgi:transposase